MSATNGAKLRICMPGGLPLQVELTDRLKGAPTEHAELKSGGLTLRFSIGERASRVLAHFFDAHADRIAGTGTLDRDAPKPEAKKSPPRRRRGGFTLVELLVVIVIIGLIAAASLPVLLPALGSRQTREAARLLTAALAGCRDRAIATGQPSGIRLLPDQGLGVGRLSDGSIDPSASLAYNRWIPIEPAPSYSEGAVTIRPGASYAAAITHPAGGAVLCPSLVLEAAPVNADGVPNPPTTWAYNMRVGDRLQINNAGPWYTVIGPEWIVNPERFVNWGAPGAPSPLNPTGNAAVEWLILVDGRDDDSNGWTDEGFDGVDNNANGLVDEAILINGNVVTEWEPEAWQGAVAAGMTSVPYSVRRRPAPTAAAREVALPTQVVIDATTWATTRERSRLPVDRFSGSVEVLVAPDGTATVQTVHGVPSSVGLDSAFLHFWLAERSDVTAPIGMKAPTLPAPKGNSGLVTLSTRTGRMGSLEDPDPATAFSAAQQGVSQ